MVCKEKGICRVTEHPRKHTAYQMGNIMSVCDEAVTRQLEEVKGITHTDVLDKY